MFKRKLKKVLIFLLLIILILQISPISYATGSSEPDPFGKFIDGIAGILFIGVKIMPAIVGKVLSLIMNGISGENITIYNILFNNVELTRINFFDATSGSETVNAIKQNVAIWYVGIRNLAAVILALILIYVAIRMAISTIAEDKAKYKTMLFDWLTSLCLLFVLHYIMIFTIGINNTLVGLLSRAGSSVDLTSVENQLFSGAFSVGFIEGLGNSIAYMMLVGMSFIYFFSYIKRMITLAFLIIIAPLITVTYSIDKMGDGKSQALNTWLKEFIYNILIQPFQCIIYLSLVSSVLGLITNKGLASVSLINVFIAVYVLMFMYQAEEIVKKIFGFQADSMGKTIASAAITTTLISRGTSLFKAGSTKNKVGAPTPYQRRPNTPGGNAPSPNGGGNAPRQNGGGNAPRQNGGGNAPAQNGGGNAPAPNGGGNAPAQNGGGNAPAQNGGGNAPTQNGGGNAPTPNGGGNTPPQNGEQNVQTANRGNRVIKGFSKGVGKLFRANIKGGLWVTGLALGLSTGDLKGGVAGASLGSAASSTVNKSLDKRRDKRNEKLRQSQIARDIDEYQGQNGYNNNQVYQTIEDWLDGISVPDQNDDSALKLYQHIMEHRDGLEESGLSQDSVRESIDRLVQDTFSGAQTRNDPPTIPQRARRTVDNVGNIVNSMRNRFNNGGRP